jgi:hypothetical protein
LTLLVEAVEISEESQKAGRITTAGLTKEVVFEPVDGQVNDRIDEAYRTKYRGSSYLEPMVGVRARKATVKIVPRGIVE